MWNFRGFFGVRACGLRGERGPGLHPRPRPGAGSRSCTRSRPNAYPDTHPDPGSNPGAIAVACTDTGSHPGANAHTDTNPSASGRE